jgi:rod shape-determining protein MreD
MPDFIKRLIVFFVFLLVQVLVCSRIQLFYVATPLLYVYFILMFPREYPRWGVLLWSFTLGISIDMFANTPGLTAASTTFIGMLQPRVLSLFISRDMAEHIPTTARAMTWPKFTAYATFLVVAYCLVYCTLEAFSFFDIVRWALSVAGSAVLTLVLIIAIENFRSSI